MGEGRISNIIETTETDLGMPAKKKQVQTLYRRCVAVQSMILYQISRETIYDTVNLVMK